MNKKKDTNIRPYEGEDSFYSGTDEEYEEFLKNTGIASESAGEAEPVENTQRINLNDTINIQNVIDRFKKTAGDLGHTARSLRESVVSKVDAMKSKKDIEMADTIKVKKEDIINASKDISEKDDGEAEIPVYDKKNKDSLLQQNGGSIVPEEIKSSMESSAARLNEIKAEVDAISDMPEMVGGFTSKLDAMSGSLSQILDELKKIETRLDTIDNHIAENKAENAQNNVDVHASLGILSNSISDVRQAVGSVSKLNDSIFDLKNNQLNAKNSVSNLETAVARLKKKCILGITVISILSAIIIALEVLLMLS